MSDLDEMISTPPRSQVSLYQYISAHSRAPRRNQLDSSISPPKVRNFEYLEESLLKCFTQKSPKLRKRDKENEAKYEIKLLIDSSSNEDWLLKIKPGYSHNYPIP